MQTAVAGLTEALAARGHAVSVVTLDRGPKGERLAPGTRHDVPYARVARVGPRRYPFAPGLLRHLRGADLVHAHGLDGLTDTVVATRRWHRAAVGVSTHGGYFHTPRARRLKEVWLRTWTAHTLHRAGAVWFTSEADRERLAAARVQGEVVPNGVDVARFAALPREPEAGRWIVPGRVDVHKGLDDLVDALGVLRWRDRRPFRVDVVGTFARPDLEGWLRGRIAGHGLEDRVVVHGPVDAATWEHLLSRAELALFPSRYEGFGLALVEAMAAGLPVVARAIPAFERLVRPGVDGWLIAFDDPGRAADEIEAVRDADLRAIGTTARVAARAHGWDHRVLAWEDAYVRLLERR